MSDVDTILRSIPYSVHEALNNYELAGAQIAGLITESVTRPIAAGDPDREQAEASIGAAVLALGVLARRFGLTLDQAVATNLARIYGARSGGLQMAKSAERATKEQS